MSFKFNPITGNLDLVGEGGSVNVQQKSAIYTFSKFVCGRLSSTDFEDANIIDCCSLPITTTRNNIDLGTLDDLCN